MRLSLALGFSALAAGFAHAQQPTAPHPWSPLLGCWVQDVEPGARANTSPTTCVLPVEGDPLAAEFVTYVGDEETRRSRIVADGTRRDFSTETCRGSEIARFAIDGGRVFLQSEMACGNEPPTRGTGVLGLTESGRFLRVLGGGAGDAPDVRFTLQRRLSSSEVPRAIRSVIEASTGSAELSATPSALATSALVEASGALSTPVLEIWIVAQSADASNPYALTEQSDRDLSEAGVAENVRALLDALQHPDEYRLVLSSGGAAVTKLTSDETRKFRQVAEAMGVSTSISAVGSAHDSQFLANASGAPVGSSCLGARVLMTSGYGTYGATPAFAHVLYARVCPTNGFYDPQTMNGVLYGAYGGPGGGDVGGKSRPRGSGQSGDDTPAADGARRRSPGTELDGGASRGRPSSHPAPESIPLGGLGTPASSPSAPASSAPVTPPVRPSPRERIP